MPKMRWDCEEGNNCFNKKRRPKIEVFDDCFPGRIAFGDVDAVVEMNSKFLMLEWKGDGGQLHTGQQIMYRNLTACSPFLVYVIHGDAESMTVNGFVRFWQGVQYAFIDANLEDMKELVRRWAAYATNRRVA